MKNVADRSLPFVLAAILVGMATVLTAGWSNSKMEELRRRFQRVRFPNMEVEPAGELEVDVQDLIEADPTLTVAEQESFRWAAFLAQNGWPLALVALFAAEIVALIWVGHGLNQQAVRVSDSKRPVAPG